MQERTAMDRQTYVIDIGTNSVRMMKAAVADGRVKRLWKTLRTVRTGEGVNASGRLSEAAMARTIGALKEYREIMETGWFSGGKVLLFCDQCRPRFCQSGRVCEAGGAGMRHSRSRFFPARRRRGMDLRVPWETATAAS